MIEGQPFWQSFGGGGGGALQLVSRTGIDITSTGGAPALINVGGGGGGGDYLGQDPFPSFNGGGGSGGAILLEAPSVTVTGPGAALAANGGGGGGGCRATGNDGRDDSTPAKGGICAGPTLGSGGAGGAALDTPHPGWSIGGADNARGGGGGGSVGRIRVNTADGQLILDDGAITSPFASRGVLRTR